MSCTSMGISTENAQKDLEIGLSLKVDHPPEQEEEKEEEDDDDSEADEDIEEASAAEEQKEENNTEEEPKAAAGEVDDDASVVLETTSLHENNMKTDQEVHVYEINVLVLFYKIVFFSYIILCTSSYIILCTSYSFCKWRRVA